MKSIFLPLRAQASGSSSLSKTKLSLSQPSCSSGIESATCGLNILRVGSPVEILHLHSVAESKCRQKLNNFPLFVPFPWSLPPVPPENCLTSGRKILRRRITCPPGQRRSTWVKVSDTEALLRCTDPLPYKPDHQDFHKRSSNKCACF